MNGLSDKPVTVEKPARTMSGFPILALNIATCITVPFILVDGIRMAEWGNVAGAAIVVVAMYVIWRGFLCIQPNEACVLVAWGEYRGTVRETGFHWTNPMARKERLSLRAESFSVDRVRVHDKHGAPVELAAVVVWRIIETARASFDVNCVTDFVRNQCESAVKHLAGNGPESIDLTPRGLRGSVGELQEKLQGELQSRVTRAGVVIDEVRLTQRCENWSSNHIHSDIEV